MIRISEAMKQLQITAEYTNFQLRELMDAITVAYPYDFELMLCGDRYGAWKKLDTPGYYTVKLG